MKLTLDKKIITGFVACSLVLSFVAVISFRNSERFAETNQWIDHTHEVLYEFDQILINSVDAETGVRGYVIADDESYLEPFIKAKTKLFEHIKRVKELTKDNPDQQEDVNEIERLADIHVKYLERKIELRKKDFEQAKALVLTGEGKRIEDEIRQKVDHARKIEQVLLGERRQNSENDARNFNLIFIILLLVIGLVLAIVYFIISANLTALKNAEKEAADKSWAQTGSADLVKDMQGNKLLTELSETIINHLTPYLNAQVGAIYITEDDSASLKLFGAHAIDRDKKYSGVVRFGEGLVGQAASEGRTILLSNIPAGQFNLNTSFGEVLPKNIIAVPFVFEDRVVGVIELGNIHDFTSIQSQFLQGVADNIAIAITSAQARSKTKELLEETQRQAKELEAQQEEVRQTNEQLRRSEERYHLMIEEVQDYAIIFLNKDGLIENWNKGAEKIKGYKAEEVIGKSFKMFYTPEDKQKGIPDELLRKAALAGKVEHEGWRVKKDGSTFWGSVVLTALHGGRDEIIGFSKVTRDLTARKAAEDELKRNAAMLEEQNRALEQSELELKTQQHELRQSNDELHTKTELLERSGLELKTQQEELKQVNEKLEEKANILEEQKEKLENAKAEIETKVREIEVTSKYKSEFLANMSHELRTPLNSILILSQLLSENKNENLNKKDIEFAKNIHNSGTDLLNLIDDILDLSKIEAGKIQLDIEEIFLKDIVSDLSSLFSEIAKSKSVDFSIDFNEKVLPTTITTDKQKVQQILKNLISNAFKFTNKGGKVTLKIDKPSSQRSFKNKGSTDDVRHIAFSVSDTGIGIPKDRQEVIFEAFQQADGSTKRKYGGTGLGLSISRELAAVLGAEIHLDSTEGKGSTFTIYLPLQYDASSSLPTEKQVEIKKTETIKDIAPPKIEEEIATDDRHHLGENDKIILIIEDDKQFSEILLDFVRERKYKGIIASQGSTGLSYARHYKPVAILLDMNLPVMDGVEVLKQLKNDPNLRHIPIQIISGYDQKKEGLELGAFNFIKKPVSASDLKTVFDRIEGFARKKIKKLLIIEDNELQNKAIRELIENNEVKCLSAYSGSQAYEMLKTEGFDCIIVDLGLPDMSGFDLLERIKADDQLNRIPIVVYTGRDLRKDETVLLSKLADTVVLKTANSKERLLDETILFLHQVESRLSKDKQSIIRKLHKTDQVLKNKTVLLVDDDIRNIYSLTNVLEDEGIKCMTAENGKVALNILKANPPIDLVLMDIMMPEMDGYEATTEIRKLPVFKKLPIIALTAKAMKGDKEKCLAVGMSDYVSKPVNIEQLLSLLRVWLYK